MGGCNYINVLVAQWLEHRSYEIFEDSRGSAVQIRTRTDKNVYIIKMFIFRPEQVVKRFKCADGRVVLRPTIVMMQGFKPLFAQKCIYCLFVFISLRCLYNLTSRLYLGASS